MGRRLPKAKLTNYHLISCDVKVIFSATCLGKYRSRPVAFTDVVNHALVAPHAQRADGIPMNARHQLQCLARMEAPCHHTDTNRDFFFLNADGLSFTVGFFSSQCGNPQCVHISQNSLTVCSHALFTDYGRLINL